jgi:hypothetical protein
MAVFDPLKLRAVFYNLVGGLKEGQQYKLQLCCQHEELQISKKTMSFEHFFGKLQMTVGKTMRDKDLEKQMMQWFRPSTFRHSTRNDMKWTSHLTGCSYHVAGESTES